MDVTSLPDDVVKEVSAWLSWLPAEERTDCLRELVADFVAGAKTGD